MPNSDIYGVVLRFKKWLEKKGIQFLPRRLSQVIYQVDRKRWKVIYDGREYEVPD